MPDGHRSVVVTARRWELAHAEDVADWLSSSGLRHRMLRDVCVAVETTVRWLVEDGFIEARDVLAQYPNVLSRCDDLRFDDPAQALAYLILHLPDRFSRMFDVLQRLFALGSLPIGRSQDFAAIDIGAGPGPGIFAIRGFYAAIARYATVHDPMPLSVS
jgi:ribosomal protein RSM22 (predicted rRNA methylase)